MRLWTYRRHITVALGVKAVALTALWWFFVRDSRVAVHEEAAAAHLLSVPAAPVGAARPTDGALR